MIVEFIGSTGAGKTTLISEVQRRLAETAQVTTSFDVVATPLRLQGVTNPTARNLIQESACMPQFVFSLNRHRSFLVFVLRMLARHGRFTFRTVNYLRSLERTIGTYEVVRRRAQHRIVLVDEGTIVPAHNVFVFTQAHYTDEEIIRYAALAPLPDTIIYVRAPADALVRRTLQRTDPPREMAVDNPALIEATIERAVDMFDRLVTAEEIRSRTLTVDNPDRDENGRALAVDNIVEFLMNSQTIGQRGLEQPEQLMPTSS